MLKGNEKGEYKLKFMIFFADPPTTKMWSWLFTIRNCDWWSNRKIYLDIFSTI